MAQRRVEDQLAALRQIAADGATPAAIAALRKGLADRIALVPAKAAQIAGELHAHDLLPDLLRAFDRLFDSPDPQCWGKNAIAKALAALDYRESPPFLRGSRHIQMEPVWGGEEDAAITLRGICTLALASCTDLRREDILRHLVDRLTEKAASVRLEAARAIAQMGGDDAALLLRLKAGVGDVEARVVGQVFDCLLELEGERAVEFLSSFFHSQREGEPEEAALSLGTSRLPRAIEVLEEQYEAARDPDLRLSILRGLSASRQERALSFLLAIVREGRERDAGFALAALELHKGSPEIWARVEAVIRPQ